MGDCFWAVFKQTVGLRAAFCGLIQLYGAKVGAKGTPHCNCLGNEYLKQEPRSDMRLRYLTKYCAVSDQKSISSPGIRVDVFSDRDINTKRKEVRRLAPSCQYICRRW